MIYSQNYLLINKGLSLDLTSHDKGLKIVHKSLEERNGIYFLIDDAGLAWQPMPDGFRQVFGHISRDRKQVMFALKQHIKLLQAR